MAPVNLHSSQQSGTKAAPFYSPPGVTGSGWQLPFEPGDLFGWTPARELSQLSKSNRDVCKSLVRHPDAQRGDSYDQVESNSEHTHKPKGDSCLSSFHLLTERVDPSCGSGKVAVVTPTKVAVGVVGLRVVK